MENRTPISHLAKAGATKRSFTEKVKFSISFLLKNCKQIEDIFYVRELIVNLCYMVHSPIAVMLSCRQNCIKK